MFLQVSVCPQGGGYPSMPCRSHDQAAVYKQVPPRMERPPWMEHPLGWRTPPGMENPPGWRTPLGWRTPPDGEPPQMETPPDAEPPWDGEPPPQDGEPPWDGDPPRMENPPDGETPPMVTVQVVHILLECILVLYIFPSYLHWTGWYRLKYQFSIDCNAFSMSESQLSEFFDVSSGWDILRGWLNHTA